MTSLYIVHVKAAGMGDLPAAEEVITLDRGLYLVRTAQMRSQLYHAVKRRLAPDALLVAPLAGLPKFKGMRPGSTALARSLAGGLDLPA